MISKKYRYYLYSFSAMFFNIVGYSQSIIDFILYVVAPFLQSYAILTLPSTFAMCLFMVPVVLISAVLLGALVIYLDSAEEVEKFRSHVHKMVDVTSRLCLRKINIDGLIANIDSQVDTKQDLSLFEYINSFTFHCLRSAMFQVPLFFIIQAMFFPITPLVFACFSIPLSIIWGLMCCDYYTLQHEMNNTNEVSIVISARIEGRLSDSLQAPILEEQPNVVSDKVLRLWGIYCQKSNNQNLPRPNIEPVALLAP